MTDDELFEQWWRSKDRFTSTYGDYDLAKAAFLAALKIGADREREECARDAEKHYFHGEELSDWHQGYSVACADIAAAIRGRG